jgi:hypothetical protein
MADRSRRWEAGFPFRIHRVSHSSSDSQYTRLPWVVWLLLG